MLENYTNQNLTWQSIESGNEYNEPTYMTTTIKGRKETINKRITTQQGQEIVVNTLVITIMPILCNDLIDGKTVISVESAVDLDGYIRWYEVYLQ